MKRIKGQTGMSLVEATIILLVLMLLTAVLAPSIFDYYRDAQTVKVKEDCEAIGLSVARLTRDVGSCLKLNHGDCTMTNRADILYSDGVAAGYAGAGLYTDAVSFAGFTNKWTDGANRSPMTAQFTTNAGINDQQLYDLPNAAAFLNSTPTFGLGWRGAYLSSPIGADPWGHQYLVNSEFLAVATNAGSSAATEGVFGWNRDVFCISAAFNEVIETPLIGSNNGGVVRQGDDFIYVISGSSR